MVEIAGFIALIYVFTVVLVLTWANSPLENPTTWPSPNSPF
jgi:hypothetical protein